MFLVGVVGNVYTLVVINVSLRVTGTMYVYIVNLALADLLYLTTIPFVVCTYFAKDWYFKIPRCDQPSGHLCWVKALQTHRHLCGLAHLFSPYTPNNHHDRAEEERSNGAEKRMCHPTWQITAYKVYLTVLFNTCILAPGCIIGYLYLKLARVYWVSQTTEFSSNEINKCYKPEVFYKSLSVIKVSIPLEFLNTGLGCISAPMFLSIFC
uniref:G-protein coupled receptors family 1 profile domain-containing protein n=1 Tax=Electrophorus electricus TaxID=8005 RepID=A0AAY5EIY7_ELEEL